MKKITLLDTAVGSTNKGDDIIMRCIQEEMSDLFSKYFILRTPTHLTNSTIIQNFGRLPDSLNEMATSKYKFICGTNLLQGNMMHRTNQWNMSLFNNRAIRNCIGVGLGVLGNDQPYKISLYTKLLLKNTLSHEFLHSVREENALLFLNKIGISAIETGCVTLWKLTPDFCRKIPKGKSDTAVFTLTDYKRDPKHDRFMVKSVIERYKNVYFWPQGIYDRDYLNEISEQKLTDKINVLPADVDAYERILSLAVDYIGTRLHAGILAMRHGCRAVILSVDTRMYSMAKYFETNMLARKEVEAAIDLIDKEFVTKVNIDSNAIMLWKAQFE